MDTGDDSTTPGYGYRESASPLATIEWWADVDGEFTYTEAATEFWGLAFGVLADGQRTASLIGPATAPRELHMTAGEQHWGVEFPPHVFLRGLEVKPLNEMRELRVDGEWFILANIRFPFPDRFALAGLLDKLSTQGVLVAEAAVADALNGVGVPYSDRSVRRLFSSATGLRQKQIQQLRRARDAYQLLAQGYTLGAAASAVGYADQAHMTRAFQLFAGSSPGRILVGDASPFDSRPL